MFLLEERTLVDAYPIALHSFRHWYGLGEFEYLQRIDDPLTHVLFGLMKNGYVHSRQRTVLLAKSHDSQWAMREQLLMIDEHVPFTKR
jgi:hypothetical protein